MDRDAKLSEFTDSRGEERDLDDRSGTSGSEPAHDGTAGDSGGDDTADDSGGDGTADDSGGDGTAGDRGGDGTADECRGVDERDTQGSREGERADTAARNASDAGEPPEAADEVAESTGNADAGVEPLPTSTFSPKGAACDRCDAAVRRLWRSGQRRVCANCRDW